MLGAEVHVGPRIARIGVARNLRQSDHSHARELVGEPAAYSLPVHIGPPYAHSSRTCAPGARRHASFCRFFRCASDISLWTPPVGPASRAPLRGTRHDGTLK